MRRRQPSTLITPRISKAARALLDLRQEDMAKQVGISTSTIRRFEGGMALNSGNDAKMVAFLKANGIVFLYRGGEIIGLLEGNNLEDIIFDY